MSCNSLILFMAEREGFEPTTIPWESVTSRFYVPRNATNAIPARAACPILPDGRIARHGLAQPGHLAKTRLSTSFRLILDDYPRRRQSSYSRSERTLILDYGKTAQRRLVVHLPWAHEASFQSVRSISRFLSLSNNLGNLLFARQTTLMAVSDRVLIRF